MIEYVRKDQVLEIIKRTSGDHVAAWAEVNKLPAAEVAVVVRCENCAFSQSDGWVCGGTALMPPHQTFPDSFCECGAKMDGGVDHACL